MKSLFKKSFAEFIGTFVLVFFACGVAAFTGGELVPTALTFGLVIVAMAYSVGKVSGCHINPAVSIACLAEGRMSAKEFIVYVIAQILGAIVGGIAIFGIAAMGGKELAGDACNAVLSDGAGGIIGAILTEIILTCVFTYVILNVTDNSGAAGKKAGIIIGPTLTLVHLLGINLTGTSVNPARSIGTAVAALAFNGNAAPLAQVWVFIVAPLVGGLLSAVLYKCLNKAKK